MRRDIAASLRSRTVLIILSLVVPLLAVILLFNIYTAQRTNERVYENSLNTIKLYQNALESDLHNIDNLLIALMANDVDFAQLRYPLPRYDMVSNLYDVTNRYRDLMAAYSIIGAISLETEANGVSRTVYNGEYDYNQKTYISDKIGQLIANNENPGAKGWFFEKAGTRTFLFRILGQNGLFLICLVDPEKMAAPQNLIRGSLATDEEGFLVYATAEAEAATMTDRVKNEGIKLESRANSYYVTGKPQKYFAVSGYSAYADTSLFYMQEYDGFLGKLDRVQGLLLTGSIILSFLLPAALYLLNHAHFRPMKRLLETMDKIRAGDLDAKMDENYTVTEFQKLSTAFNGMVDEIKNLKIEFYEEEIDKQKIQFLLLQSQIRPHFYLNCLKNIQALAQERRYDSIQDMVLELSGYLRYMFKDGSSMVRISDEMESVHNYISLQRMSSSNPPECHVNIAAEVEAISIPSLSILTFVENSVKHGSFSGRTLEIGIKGLLLKSGEGDYVNLTITDNGKGFSPAVLAELNRPGLQYEEGHIGIANVRHRFDLIYRGRSTFVFSNQKQGSCIEIFIPLDVAEQEQTAEKEQTKEGTRVW